MGKAGLILEPCPPNFENQYNFWRCVNDIEIIFWYLLVSDFQRSVWSVQSISVTCPCSIIQYSITYTLYLSGMDHSLLEVPMILERIMRKKTKTNPMIPETLWAGVMPCSELLRPVIWKTAWIDQMAHPHFTLVAKKECLWNKAKQRCRLNTKPWWLELLPNDYGIDDK